MNWLIIILFFTLNIQCEYDLISVKKIFFLENDLWCADLEKNKTKIGYLSKVNVRVEREGTHVAGFTVFSEKNYLLNSTNLGYVALDGCLIFEDIISFLESPQVDKLFWKFCFFFTGKPIYSSDNFERYQGRIQDCYTYKFLQKISENEINLRRDSIYIRLKHIKEWFRRLLSMRFMNFKNYIEVVEQSKKLEKLTKIGNGIGFVLNYFNNYYECFECLKNFIKDLSYFKLVEDNFNSLANEFSGMSINKTVTLKVSQFKERICEKFIDDLEKMYDTLITSLWQSLVDRCCDYIEDRIVNNNIFLPIVGKYDIDYYIEQFSDMIYESTKSSQGKTSAMFARRNDSVLFAETASKLNADLEKFQMKVVGDIFESEYIPKHFSKFLGKEIRTMNDYNNVEEIMCDYYNMFAYIYNLYHKLQRVNVSVPYFNFPIFVENYNMRIVDGFKILVFDWGCTKQLKGFDYKGEEISLEEDVDYFIDEMLIIYCPLENLKMKNIYEIRVTSYGSSRIYGRFNINDNFDI